jgi:hypothetical protein
MAKRAVANIAFPPGVHRTSTFAGAAAMPPPSAGKWFDAHLIRWVAGRLRPIGGWEEINLPTYIWADGTKAHFASPCRAMHSWPDLAGVIRHAFLCERHLYVLTGSVMKDITPAGGIQAPPVNSAGGFGDDNYSAGAYGTPRAPQAERRDIGDVWRLQNWGEDLLAMASSDGRLLRWRPNAAAPELTATIVPNAPVSNRTFVVTAERHVILFAMGGAVNKFGWCSQEQIEDWNFADTTNSAGFYEIEPLSRIINAQVARYATIFWTIHGSFSITYKGLPYIYGYEYVGAFGPPISGMAPVVFSGNVMWPATDGFWLFTGTAVTSVPCTILDWWQQTRCEVNTRRRMVGLYLGAQSELWFFFPERSQPENTHVIIYNFDEKWWSKGMLSRSAGFPGTIANYPFLTSIRKVYRHEKGSIYGSDLPMDPLEPTRTLYPYVLSGAINFDQGDKFMMMRQILMDTESDRDAVEVEVFASKGRNSDEDVYSKGRRRPRPGGKVDYRLTGRDFAIKLSSAPMLKPWTLGQLKFVFATRGNRGAIVVDD